MKKSSFDYIKQAYGIVRKNFKKNWFPLLFMFTATSIATLSVVLAPFAPLILMGTVLQLIDTGEIKLENILSEIKITFDRFFTLFVLNGLVGVIVLTGFVFFIIPGIILSYSLAAVFYLAHKHPKLDPGTLIKQSMALMDGHKMRYFTLNLVTGIIVYVVVFVATLANIIPILGQIIFVAVLIGATILPPIAQVLFIVDLKPKTDAIQAQ
jgi:uncharacterized membrane protein